MWPAAPAVNTGWGLPVSKSQVHGVTVAVLGLRSFGPSLPAGGARRRHALRKIPGERRTHEYVLEDICNGGHNINMKWEVIFQDEFDEEFKAFDEGLQDELLSHAILLQDYGPNLGRPTVDTLKGSAHANMKELRFEWEGEVWRVAFAFDPKRKAVLLVGGDKAGVDQKRFYKKLINVADERFERHLASLTAKRDGRKGKEKGHGKKS